MAENALLHYCHFSRILFVLIFVDIPAALADMVNLEILNVFNNNIEV